MTFLVPSMLVYYYQQLLLDGFSSLIFIYTISLFWETIWFKWLGY
jgi:hypothetical protein